MSTRRNKDVTDEIDELRRKVDRLIRKGLDKLTPLYIRKIPKDTIAVSKDTVSINGTKKTIPKDTISFTVDTVAKTLASRYEIEVVDGLHQNEAVFKIGFSELA